MADKPFIATEDIYFGARVLAHVKGDTVPAENVQANGWEHLVAHEGTKAATEAVEG